MEKTPYCGKKEVPPSGKRLATLKECADKHQIRRYGRFKASKEVLDPSYKAPKPTPSLYRLKQKSSKLLIQLVKKRGRITKYTRDLEDEKEADKKAELKDMIKKEKQLVNTMVKEYNDILDKIEELKKK